MSNKTQGIGDEFIKQKPGFELAAPPSVNDIGLSGDCGRIY
jgi:hypothetical protein